jgi:hypothetical protein
MMMLMVVVEIKLLPVLNVAWLAIWPRNVPILRNHVLVICVRDMGTGVLTVLIHHAFGVVRLGIRQEIVVVYQKVQQLFVGAVGGLIAKRLILQICFERRESATGNIWRRIWKGLGAWVVVGGGMQIACPWHKQLLTWAVIIVVMGVILDLSVALGQQHRSVLSVADYIIKAPIISSSEVIIITIIRIHVIVMYQCNDWEWIILGQRTPRVINLSGQWEGIVLCHHHHHHHSIGQQIVVVIPLQVLSMKGIAVVLVAAAGLAYGSDGKITSNVYVDQ